MTDENLKLSDITLSEASTELTTLGTTTELFGVDGDVTKSNVKINTQNLTTSILSGLSAGSTEILSIESGDKFYGYRDGTGNFKIDELVIFSGSDIPNNSKLIYVSDLGSDTTGTGSINKPFLTYDQALSHILTFSPNENNQFCIMMQGRFFISTALTLHPFIHLCGASTGSTYISTLASMDLSTSWASATNPTCTISNLTLNAGSTITLSFLGYRLNTKLVFRNCDFKGALGLIINGVLPNPANDLATVVFSGNTCVGEPFSMNLLNVNAYFLNSVFPGDLFFGTYASPISLNTKLVIENCATPTPNDGSTVVLLTDAGVALHASIQGTRIDLMQLDGGGSRLIYCDSASYNFVPNFLWTSSISDIQLISGSDGVKITFTPSNYTPIGTPTRKSNSLTAHLAGINNGLPVFLNYVAKALKNEDVKFLDSACQKTGRRVDVFSELELTPTSKIFTFTKSVPEGKVDKILSAQALLIDEGGNFESAAALVKNDFNISLKIPDAMLNKKLTCSLTISYMLK